MTMRNKAAALMFGAVTLIPLAAAAQSCSNTGAGFDRWLRQYAVTARKKGISQSTINRAFRGVTYNRRVIRLDRSQRSFKQSFSRFYKRRASPYMHKRARTREKCGEGVWLKGWGERDRGKWWQLEQRLWCRGAMYGKLNRVFNPV